MSRVAREREFGFLLQSGRGNDELVFDGGSFVVDSKGDIVGRAKSFEEDLIWWKSIESQSISDCRPLNVKPLR